MNLLTFEDALKLSQNYNKRHLLLGNGFSIACRPNIFVYKKLFEQADFSSLSPNVKKAFDELGTSDFECVIKSLRSTAKVVSAYKKGSDFAEELLKDAESVKELLVKTIAKSHPNCPTEIEDEEYLACQKFLSNFDTTYTLNYDLLLYWTNMFNSDARKITSDDGFRTSYNDKKNM